ncbi:MAG: PilZ domain-containing protein [Pseudomonadota bacterium]
MAFDIANLRREKRRNSEQTALIKWGMVRSAKCDLTDLAVSGAKLKLHKDQKLPKRFELTVFGAGQPRRHTCKVRWRDGVMVGVEFDF